MRHEGQRSEYMDRTGEVAIDLGMVYETLGPFKNGLAYVCRTGSHEGYLKKDGIWAFQRKLKDEMPPELASLDSSRAGP
jgi:hypothetical protein